MHKEDCIFCRIIKGEIPSEKVYEDESCLSFLSIGPTNPGHTLVIPKNHSNNMFSTKEEDFSKVMSAVLYMAPKIAKAVSSNGFNIGINNGKAAGQEVFHLHVHIIPRFDDDGYKHWGENVIAKNNLKEVGSLIRKEIENANS